LDEGFVGVSNVN